MTINGQNISTRSSLPDFMKGAAVILMIQVHLVELFAEEAIYNSGLGKFLLFLGGPPAAPLFMVVMGYFLAESKKTTSQNILRGLKLFLVGILLNAGINLHLFVKIIFGEIQVDPLPYLLGVDILPLAGLSIIIISVIKKIFRDKIFLYLIFLLVVILSSDFLYQSTDAEKPIAYIQAFFWGQFNWSYFPVFPWLVYPLVGFIISVVMSKSTIDERNLFHFSVPASIVSVATISYGINTAANLKVYYHHNWIYIFWTLQFLIVITYLSYQLVLQCDENKIVRYLKWLGRNVTLAYIMQWLIIGYFATSLFRSQNEIMLLFWFVLIVASVSLLTSLFKSKKIF